MISVFKQMRRVGLAAVALGAIGVSGTAFAQNTASGTTITNTATINYTVNAIAQTPIAASTNFVVDTVVNLNVTGGTTVNVTPGQTAAVTVFTLTNTSNVTSNFTLAATNRPNPAEDDFDMAALAVRVDGNGNGTYEAGADTGTAVTGLARNASVTVFIVGNVPAAATNTQDALARLTATAINPTTTVAWVADAGADVPGTVQIVVRNGSAFAQDTYVVSTAALAVTKSSTVISDPFNLVSPNAKAIPGAVVEYTIAVANSGAQPATLQSVSDPIPANTTFVTGQYTGSSDVSVQVGASPATFCVAESGVDTNADGCVRSAGGTLTVGAPAVTTVAAGTTVNVRFRVTIN